MEYNPRPHNHAQRRCNSRSPYLRVFCFIWFGHFAFSLVEFSLSVFLCDAAFSKFPHAACGSWLVSSDQGLFLVLEGTDIPCQPRKTNSSSSSLDGNYTSERKRLVRPQPWRNTLRFGGCTRLNTSTRDSTTCTRARAGTQTNTQVASQSTRCTPRWAMTDKLDQYRLRRFDIGRVIMIEIHLSSALLMCFLSIFT